MQQYSLQKSHNKPKQHHHQSHNLTQQLKQLNLTTQNTPSPKLEQSHIHLDGPSTNDMSYQIARLLVNQKLTYVKACNNYQKLQIQNIFRNYPFTSIDGFRFPKRHLIEEIQSSKKKKNNQKIINNNKKNNKRSMNNPECKKNKQKYLSSEEDDGCFQIHGKLVKNSSGMHIVQQITNNNNKSNRSINLPVTLQNKINLQNLQQQYQYEQGLFNGLSISLFSNSQIFQGNYHDGKPCGKGLLISQQGDLYIGEFLHGLKHGFGIMYWLQANQIYKGYWQNDLPNGLGTYYTKQSTYQGNFINGVKSGFGIQRYKQSKQYYVGQYLNGISQGYGQYYWTDGSFYKGDFNYGVRHGFGVWENNKELYQGYYKYDQKDGFGIYLWKEKKIYKGRFRENYKQGYGQIYVFSRNIKQPKLLYKGGWVKGEECSSLPISKNQICDLYDFLNQTKSKIQDIAGKKQRLGHKNCIPGHHQNGRNTKGSPFRRERSK